MKLGQDILHTVMMVAQEMTEVGAEISRVEESVDRMCAAYGAVRTDVFATTSNIIVSVENENGDVLTQTRRIKNHISNNMEKLHQYNDLVRYITNEAPENVKVIQRLNQVRDAVRYPVWVSVLSHMVISSCFCVLFGGRDYRECIVALVVGAFTGILTAFLEHGRINPILTRFLCAFGSSAITLGAVWMQFIATPDYVLIGNIMTLIPGVGLTNAIRDLFAGDVISGILRSIEALLFTLAISFGIMLPTLLWGGVL